MKRYFDNYQDENGEAIQSATVTVLNSDGSLAALFSDNLPTPTPLANPVITDQLGFFSFYVANGRYNIRFAKEGFQALTLSDVEINDLTGVESDMDAKIAAAIQAYFSAHPALTQTGPAGQGVPKGGTAGQVLKKVTNNDYDTAWETELQASGYRATYDLKPDASGNVLMDNSESNNFQLNLTQNVKLLSPTNFASGDRIHLIIQQDAIGGHTISFDSTFLVIGGTPQFDTTANLVNRMDFDRMEDGRWVITPYFLSQLGSNLPPTTTGTGGYTETLLATYPWETATNPAVVTDVKLDIATQAAYNSAANGATTGGKRLAGAEAIIAAMGNVYNLTLAQGGQTRGVVHYTSQMVVSTVGTDVVIQPGNIGAVDSFAAGAIASGIWTATFANAAGNSITLSLGTVGGTTDYFLSGSTAVGVGLRPESVTLTMPRPLDGLA